MLNWLGYGLAFQYYYECNASVALRKTEELLGAPVCGTCMHKNRYEIGCLWQEINNWKRNRVLHFRCVCAAVGFFFLFWEMSAVTCWECHIRHNNVHRCFGFGKFQAQKILNLNQNLNFTNEIQMNEAQKQEINQCVSNWWCNTYDGGIVECVCVCVEHAQLAGKWIFNVFEKPMVIAPEE